MARISAQILRRTGNTPAKPVSAAALAQLEKFLDALWAQFGIDVEFTRHFLSRVNDAREKKQPITIDELRKIFQDAFQRFGSKFKGLITGGRSKEIEAVLADLSTQLNVPFVLRVDHREGDIDLVAKTVMRKANFKSPDRFFKVEGKNMPTASDLIQKVVDGADPKDTLGVRVDEECADDFNEEEIIDEDGVSASLSKGIKSASMSKGLLNIRFTDGKSCRAKIIPGGAAKE